VSKKKHKHTPRLSPPAGPLTPRQAGLRAFRRGDFNTAIAEWSRLDATSEPGIPAALAEAHFRRALLTHDETLRKNDLRQTVELAPGEGRYWYHLGLAQHRAERLDDASAAYTRAVELGFTRGGVGLTRGLAEVERNPEVDLDALGLPETDWVTLRPIAALLRGEAQAVLDAPPPPNPNDPLAALWRGLALVHAGQVERALPVLASPAQRLKGEAEAVRALYHGLALAASGDEPRALNVWAAAAARTATPRLQAALATAQLRRIRAAVEAGDWPTVLSAIERERRVAAEHAGFRAVEVVARNRLANAAAMQGDWEAALGHWAQIRSALEAYPELGPITPILHNLGVALERAGHWEEAAEAWSALLNRLPRRATKKSPAELGLPLPVAEYRAWLRRRVLDAFKRGGRPDAAITHYRNAVKAGPDDIDLRLELADALLANDQIIAARNELQRILKKWPAHVEARLRLAEVHRQRGEWYGAELELRGVLETDPDHAAARRGLAEMLIERAHAQFDYGYFAQAKTLYEEALALTPDDPMFLVWLGNTELAQRRLPAARERFDAALAKGDLHTYVSVFTCWAQRNNLSEARGIIQRAEAAGFGSPHFYIDAAAECFKLANGPRSPLGFGFPGAPRRADDPWEQLGRDLLHQAESGRIDSIEELQHLIGSLGPLRPDLALNYAQALVHRTPDDPLAIMMLAVLQGMSGQSKAGKDSLRRAAALARKQGKLELLEEIEEFRSLVNNPFLAQASQMGMLPDFFDDEELEW